MSSREKTRRNTSAPKTQTPAIAEKRKTKVGAKVTAQKLRRPSSESVEINTDNETTIQITEPINAGTPPSEVMIRHRHPTREEKAVELKRQKEQKATIKKELEEKYDINLKDSDDSSDEEVLIRTGNVPEHWYDLYDHHGYSVKGQQVTKLGEQDELEKYLERHNDKDWWTKLLDKLNNKHVRLSKGDIEMINRIRRGTFADASIDPHDENMVIEFQNKDWIHPFNAATTPKRSFIPSKWERLKVSKFMQALKKGWMKTMA